jgi:phytoene dehydrogenase-like protein
MQRVAASPCRTTLKNARSANHEKQIQPTDNEGVDYTMTDSTQVAIIGAGIGGLTAGAILTKAGIDCIVFEAGDKPGGYLAGFSRNGFRFDSSIQWFSQCGEGAFTSNIWKYIGEDHPHCPTLHAIQRYKGPTYDYSVTTDPDQLCDQWVKDFPESSRGIRAFQRDAKKLVGTLAILNNTIRTTQTMSPHAQCLHGLKMLHRSAPLIQYTLPSIEFSLNRYFKSAGLRQIFCSQESFLSVIVPFSWAFAQNFQSAPEGGASAVIDWLVPKTKLQLNARVQRIHCNDQQRATAIELEDGTLIQTRYIIAACDIQQLYQQMLPPRAIPPRRQRAINEMELHQSCFSLFIGLDCPASQLGFSQEMINLTSETATTRQAHTNGSPTDTILMIIAPSLRDPTLAPAGKGTLMIHCPANFDYQDQWRTGEHHQRGKEYYELKEQFAETILDRVEKQFPGLRDHIEHITTASPITYWRYTGNSRGTILGSKPCGKNFRNRVSQYTTPIKNLYMGGHCAEYGGGIPIATKAGTNAALIILQQEKNAAYATLRDVLDCIPETP